jgi:hypothetical protein
MNPIQIQGPTNILKPGISRVTIRYIIELNGSGNHFPNSPDQSLLAPEGAYRRVGQTELRKKDSPSEKHVYGVMKGSEVELLSGGASWNAPKA